MPKIFLCRKFIFFGGTLCPPTKNESGFFVNLASHFFYRLPYDQGFAFGRLRRFLGSLRPFSGGKGVCSVMAWGFSVGYISCKYYGLSSDRHIYWIVREVACLDTGGAFVARDRTMRRFHHIFHFCQRHVVAWRSRFVGTSGAISRRKCCCRCAYGLHRPCSCQMDIAKKRSAACGSLSVV